MDADGDFVVVWKSEAQDGDGYGIFAQRLSSTGAAQAVEFQVNSYTPDVQEDPAVVMNASGDFLVVWASFLQDLSSRGVFGRRFSSSGTAHGVEFQINSRTASSQAVPTAAISDDGDFVVAWHSFQDGSSYGVFASRFASTGTLLGVEFQINTYTTLNQVQPAIAMSDGGAFVIAWASFEEDGSSGGIFAQRFSSDGAAAGSEFQVNLYTDGSQYSPAVAMAPDGDFVIAWHSQQDGSLFGSFARRFIRTGAALGGEFQVNTVTALPQIYPVPAIDARSGFVVTWVSVQQDGPQTGNRGIFAQRFNAPLLDVDGDGAAEALTDGLLILRRAFGFTGATLITGAVELATCTRCTAPEIESYLTVLDPLLDIDNDGQLEALTDGLLVLRWLFGFTGATLVTGAVDQDNCSRCAASEVAAHLLTLG